jgi:4a-hydroxytetrahydrobiopterin dehydratase
VTDSKAAWLRSQTCRPGAPKASSAEIDDALAALPQWSRSGEAIAKTFRFPDFHATIEFVNAVAWIANRQDHHPDLDVHYNRCGVTFSTHDAGGVTMNDLICAARVEALQA